MAQPGPGRGSSDLPEHQRHGVPEQTTSLCGGFGVPQLGYVSLSSLWSSGQRPSGRTCLQLLAGPCCLEGSGARSLPPGVRGRQASRGLRLHDPASVSILPSPPAPLTAGACLWVPALWPTPGRPGALQLAGCAVFPTPSCSAALSLPSAAPLLSKITPGWAGTSQARPGSLALTVSSHGGWAKGCAVLRGALMPGTVRGLAAVGVMVG